jgi:hypothetical protein
LAGYLGYGGTPSSGTPGGSNWCPDASIKNARGRAGDPALCERVIDAAERGKAKMVIVGAAMRKLLHICYGVLKNGTPFNPSLHPGT